jgi:hypothetical protein
MKTERFDGRIEVIWPDVSHRVEADEPEGFAAPVDVQITIGGMQGFAAPVDVQITIGGMQGFDAQIVFAKATLTLARKKTA